MPRVILLSLLIAMPGCASHAPVQSASMPSDKDFEVPATIANRFEEHDAGTITPAPAVAVPASVPVAPAPALAPVGKEEPKAGKRKGKQARKKKTKEKSAAPSEPQAAVNAVIPNRWSMNPFFHEGEKTIFDITYFGATAGQLELDVMPIKMVGDRPVYHFRAIATSTSVFSLFYRVNDVAESFMDTTGLFSYKFSLKLDESRQTRDVLELYDQEKRKAYYWSKWDMANKPRQNDQSAIDLVPFTQDGLTSFFYVRTLPLVIGEKYEFPVVNNGKLRTVRVTALRKETLATRMGDFPAIVVKPEVVLDGVLTNSGESYMWISDDADRQILKIDAKIKVGSVIAYLRERSNGNEPHAGSTP